MVEQKDQLEKYLKRQLIIQSKVERQIERVRLKIVERAQEVIDQYEKERQEIEPQAQDVIEQTIKPWWNEFRESQVYSLILRTGRRKIGLSPRFNHLWPERVFKEIKEDPKKGKPFEVQAKVGFRRI